jgi:5-methylcytosine-specific restriction enzyme B
MTEKESFMDYLQNAKNPASYKLVFLSSFFQCADAQGKADKNDVARDFHMFYLKRKKAGLLPDKVKEIKILEIDTSSEASTYGVMKSAPFKALSNQGLFSPDITDGCFVLNPGLWGSFTPSDIQCIKTILDRKITDYFKNL